MKAHLLRALSRLASESYQDLYMVHGTSEEYVLAEDLVEDVANLCRMAAETREGKLFSKAEHKALESIRQKIDSLSEGFWVSVDDCGVNHLVHENQTWRELRLLAASALRGLGVDPFQILPDQIDGR